MSGRSRWSFTFVRVALILLIALGIAAWRWRSLLDWPPTRPVIRRPYLCWIDTSDRSAPGPFTMAVLERKLPGAFQAGPTLRNAIDALRDVHQIDIFVNWNALQGVDGQTAVNINLGGQKLGDALSNLLVAADPKRRSLAFTLDEGVITISSRDDFAMNVSTRVYDIRDLLSGYQRSDYQIQLDHFIATIDSATGKPPSSTTQPRNAGHTRIRELGGLLIVTDTPENQLITGWEIDHARWKRRLQLFGAYSLRTLVPALVVAFGIELTIRLIAWHRARTSEPRCRGCGYDLRASLNRCPECGRPIDA